MRGVVLDSNVYISALLFGGIPRTALEVVQSGTFQLFISAPISREIERTLRFKFRWSVGAIREAAKTLWGTATRISPRLEISDCGDPDDNRVLECAAASGSGLIITGDTHLLDMHPWRGVSIVTPRQFLTGDY